MSWAYSILGAVTSLTSVRLQADSVPVPKWCASTASGVQRMSGTSHRTPLRKWHNGKFGFQSSLPTQSCS